FILDMIAGPSKQHKENGKRYQLYPNNWRFSFPCDEGVHWAVQNSLHLSRSTVVYFKHNNMASLASTLEKLTHMEINVLKSIGRDECLTEPNKRTRIWLSSCATVCWRLLRLPFARCSLSSRARCSAAQSPDVVDKEYADLNLRPLYPNRGHHMRIRQHVNPLSSSFLEPTGPPEWKEVFDNPLLPLMVDIGCGSGRFLIWHAKNSGKSQNYLGLEIRQKVNIIRELPHDSKIIATHTDSPDCYQSKECKDRSRSNVVRKAMDSTADSPASTAADNSGLVTFLSKKCTSALKPEEQRKKLDQNKTSMTNLLLINNARRSEPFGVNLEGTIEKRCELTYNSFDNNFENRYELEKSNLDSINILLIWDVEAQPNIHVVLGASESRPDLILTGHKENAEFALAMCPAEPYVLSGGKDKSVVLWSIQDHISALGDSSSSPGASGSKQSVKTANEKEIPKVDPRGIFHGHDNTVEDVQFCPSSAQEFYSVGNDACLILWDARTGTTPAIKVEKAHSGDVHCVDWNPLDVNYILTGYDGIKVQDVLLLLEGRELSSLGGASSSTPYSKDRMRRQGKYGEADINSMVVAQLHHYQAQQRVQKHPENSYTGRDPAQASAEHQYTPPKERQSQWDRDSNILREYSMTSVTEGIDAIATTRVVVTRDVSNNAKHDLTGQSFYRSF
ncbi:hypothetical protein ACJX0J_041750, partial [Zea mays]